MSMSNSDSRKRLAEAAGPAQDVEADLARILGDARIAQARRADWWTSDEDHALLARVLRAEVEPWAKVVLAAGYLPPAEVARLVQEARAEALHVGAVELWRVFLRLPHTPSPIVDYVQRRHQALLNEEKALRERAARPVPGERSEAEA